MSKFFYLGFPFAVAFVVAIGCAENPAADPEAAAWPADVRADYAVFAQRCSKCHSLARPLESGIDSDDYWRLYVERMRRQPGSGISVADTVPILRFLHVYSAEVKRRKGEGSAASDAAPMAPPIVSATAPSAAQLSPVPNADGGEP